MNALILWQIAAVIAFVPTFALWFRAMLWLAGLPTDTLSGFAVILGICLSLVLGFIFVVFHDDTSR